MGQKQLRISLIEWVESTKGEDRWRVELEEFRDGRWQFSMDSDRPNFPVDLEPFWRDQQDEVLDALAKAFLSLRG